MTQSKPNSAPREDPAVTELLLEQAGWVRRIARSMLGSEEDALDLAQDVMAKALESKVPDDQPGLRAWLRTVTRRMAIRRYRRRDLERSSLESRFSERRSIGHASSHGENAPADEYLRLHGELVKSLQGLGPEDRSLLVKRYIDGVAPRELALEAGVTAIVMRKRLSRSLARLRARWDQRIQSNGEDRGTSGSDPSNRIARALAILTAPVSVFPTPPPASLNAPPAPTLLGPSALVTMGLHKAALVAASVLVLGVAALLHFSDSERRIAPALNEAASGGGSALASLSDPMPVLLRAPVQVKRAEVEAAPDREATGNLKVHVVCAPEAANVPNLEVRVEYADGRRDFGKTDSDGCVYFDDITLGHARIMSASLGRAGASLAAGDNVVEVSLPGEFAVAGTVSDQSGSPIAGAALRVGGIGIRSRPPASAVTDERGRFEIKHLPQHISLLVEADGFAPFDGPELSFTQVFSGAPLDIRLERSGGELRVKVLDKAGGHIAGASVELSLDDGSPVSWKSLRAVADGDGVARFNGVQPSDLRCRVEHSGFAPTITSLSAAKVRPLDLINMYLGPGCSMEGDVLLDSGDSSAGLTVLVASQGQHYVAEVDRHGHYHLDSIHVGRHTVQLLDPKGTPVDSTTVTGRDGASLVWNPTFPSLRACLAGKILHEGDFDSSEWAVIAYDLSTGWRGSAKPNDDATFSIPCAVGASHLVALMVEGNGFHVDELDDVPAGSGSLALDSKSHYLTDRRIHGRVLDLGGSKTVGVIACKMMIEGQVSYPQPTSGGGWSRLAGDGQFEFAGLGDGTYAVWRVNNRGLYYEVGRVELAAANPVVDMGAIRATAEGQLTIFLKSESALDSELEMRYFIKREDGMDVASGKLMDPELGEAIDLVILEAGEYRVSVDDREHFAHGAVFYVAPNEDVLVQVELTKRRVRMPPSR